MSGPNTLPPVVDPQLRDLLLLLTQEILYKFNCHQLGTVQSFDDTKDTVTVSINFLRVVPDQMPAGGDPTAPVVPTQKLIQYPVLVNVPVFILGGGGGTITFPIAKGDTCLVLFNDRDIDGWFATGQVAAPNTPRAHDLADGLALIGFRSLSNPVPNYAAADVALRYMGGQILVNSKLKISNASYSMLLLLTDLVNALKGWTDTHGDTPSAPTLAALDAVQTEVDGLFK